MWMDFETKVRTAMMNMLLPIVDTMTEDRVSRKKTDDNLTIVLKKLEHLEEIILFRKRR